MSILPSEVPAVSAGAASPVRPADPVLAQFLNAGRKQFQAFEAAHGACESHPAYKDAQAVVDALERARELCEAFLDAHSASALDDHLDGLGIPRASLGINFRHLREDIVGAAWVLTLLCGMIGPEGILPYEPRSGKGGVA